MNTKHTTKLKKTPTGEDLERWAKFEAPAMAEGFTKMPNTVIRNPKLSHGAFRLYTVLLCYAWQDGFCFPGQERLAKDMGISLRMVYQYMKELEGAGFIRVQHRPLHKGVNKTNVYTFTAPNGTDCSQPSTSGTDRQDTADSGLQYPADNEDAVDEDSISPLSPLKGAASGQKEKAGSGRGPDTTSSSPHQPTPPREKQAGQERVKERSPRRRNRSRGGTPEAGIEALRNYKHPKFSYNDLKDFIPAAKKHDFTQDADPHWSIMKELDNDLIILKRLRTVVGKAVDAADRHGRNVSPSDGPVSPADSPSLPSPRKVVPTTAEGHVEADLIEEF